VAWQKYETMKRAQNKIKPVEHHLSSSRLHSSSFAQER